MIYKSLNSVYFGRVLYESSRARKCIAKFQLRKAKTWHPRFGTSETECGHHLDILGDLPAIFVGVVLTR